MDWKGLEGKQVFFKLRDGTVYNGDVIVVDERSAPIIFITFFDKFGSKVTIVNSEIVKISEEGNK
jgi:hypothetical protein